MLGNHPVRIFALVAALSAALAPGVAAAQTTVIDYTNGTRAVVATDADGHLIFHADSSVDGAGPGSTHQDEVEAYTRGGGVRNVRTYAPGERLPSDVQRLISAHR